MINTNQKVDWSFTMEDIVFLQTQTFSNLLCFDVDYIIADTVNTDGFYCACFLVVERDNLNLKTFVISSSSPPTFVIVAETHFPSNPRISAVSSHIKLICTPELRRTFACLFKPFPPPILAEMMGSKAS